MSNRSGVLPLPGQLIIKQQALRRAAGFSPLDLSNLEIWFDFSDPSSMFTDAGVTPVSGDGDKIYQINDKSGNGVNAAAPLDNRRPRYKVNIQNGLSVGMADGSDGMSFSPSAASSDQTIAAVFYPASNSINQIVFDFNNTNFMLWLNESGYYQGNDWVGFTSTPLTADAQLIIIVYDSLYSTLYKNAGSGEQESGDRRNAMGGTSAIFARYDTGGYNMVNTSWIGEIAIYSQALSEPDRNILEVYFNNKWGIF